MAHQLLPSCKASESTWNIRRRCPCKTHCWKADRIWLLQLSVLSPIPPLDGMYACVQEWVPSHNRFFTIVIEQNEERSPSCETISLSNEGAAYVSICPTTMPVVASITG